MLACRLSQSRSQSQTCSALRGFSAEAPSPPCLLNWSPVAEPVNCAELLWLHLWSHSDIFLPTLLSVVGRSFRCFLNEAASVNLIFIHPDKEIFVPLIRTWNLKVLVLLCMKKSRIVYLLVREEYERELSYPKSIKVSTRLYLGDQHWNGKC